MVDSQASTHERVRSSHSQPSSHRLRHRHSGADDMSSRGAQEFGLSSQSVGGIIPESGLSGVPESGDDKPESGDGKAASLAIAVTPLSCFASFSATCRGGVFPQPARNKKNTQIAVESFAVEHMTSCL